MQTLKAFIGHSSHQRATEYYHREKIDENNRDVKKVYNVGNVTME